jgi:hypothetical protein
MIVIDPSFYLGSDGPGRPHAFVFVRTDTAIATLFDTAIAFVTRFDEPFAFRSFSFFFLGGGNHPPTHRNPFERPPINPKSRIIRLSLSILALWWTGLALCQARASNRSTLQIGNGGVCVCRLRETPTTTAAAEELQAKTRATHGVRAFFLAGPKNKCAASSRSRSAIDRLIDRLMPCIPFAFYFDLNQSTCFGCGHLSIPSVQKQKLPASLACPHLVDQVTSCGSNPRPAAGVPAHDASPRSSPSPRPTR